MRTYTQIPPTTKRIKKKFLIFFALISQPFSPIFLLLFRLTKRIVIYEINIKNIDKTIKSISKNEIGKRETPSEAVEN